MLHDNSFGQAPHFFQNPFRLALVGDGFSQPGKLLGGEGQAGGFLPGVLPSPLVTAAGSPFGAGKDAALADKANPRQGAGQAAVLGFQCGEISLHGGDSIIAVKL